MSMPFTPDPAKSEKARQDGNASFKRGRWTEAIGHYTTAVVSNPTDPIPYTNRAAAYLKLEKYEDAERDCTSALRIAEGHVKALYRRAMARKGLERYAEALQDLDRVVQVEESEMAVNEMDEIRALWQEQTAKEEQRKRDKAGRKLPPSPPRPTASIEEIHEDEAEAPVIHAVQSVKLDDEPSKATTRPVSSFADLRKSRGDRKTYISPIPAHSPSTSITPTAHAPTTSTPPNAAPKLTSTTTSFGASSTTKKAGPSLAAQPSAPQHPRLTPPSDPHSTTTASGFQLLTRLSRLDTPRAWEYLNFYPATVVPTILAPLLEPDSLGQLLLVLRHGAESDGERVIIIIEGLKKTSRWGINTAMLDATEEKAGREAWALSGGSGPWP